jgi:predicted TIM-barrel fold metal-dependent hydrolase
MLEDGVVAEVIYPPQRTIRHFMQGTETAFHVAGIQAYNDWLLQAFCAADPERLIGIAQMPAVGVDVALEELHRCARLGARGVVLSAWPSGAATLGADDDRFFSECERLGLPISIHIGLAARGKVAPKPATPVEERARRGEGTGARQVSVLSAAGLDSMPLIVGEIVLAGVHDRFPNLQFVSVEAGIGWVPYFGEQLDDRYQRNQRWAKVSLQRRPSEYMRANWYFTFVQDHYGVRNREAIGVERCLWSTDYPHHGCDWPHSRRVVDGMFAGVPPADRDRITFGNCVGLYGLRLSENLLSATAA